MQSTDIPSGPGWVRLSNRTYMNNLKPITRGEQIFEGKQHIEGQWCDVAVRLIQHNRKNLEEVNLHLKLKDHPNIIHLYDVDELHQGIIPYIYIVTELFSQSLNDFIEERKQFPFDFQQHFTFAKQIVSGVAFIHRSNILHRDIKLENLLLSPSKDRVLVANFGFGKQILDGRSHATASFRGLGADGYRAPELLHDNPKASFHSDSFAIGIVLAMLFSNGRHPFGPDPARWRTNITDNQGLDLSHIITFKEPYTYKRALLVDLIEGCLLSDHRLRPTPEKMLQHRFFIAESSKNTDMDDIVREARSNVPATSSASATNDDSFNETDDQYTADPIDQFLIARSKKVDRLEKDLSKALAGGQNNHLQILKELKRARETDDLDIILQLAEYELVSKKNESCIEKVHRVISDAGTRSANDVREHAVSLRDRGQYAQAMILFKICHDMHKEEGKYAPDNELTWITNRVTDFSTAIRPMLKADGRSREVAKTYGIRFTEELLNEVRATKGATPQMMVLREIGCLVNITGNLSESGQCERSILYGEEGVKKMRQHFGDRTIYYKAYAGVLNNLGNAYGHIGNYSKAQQCYKESIEVKSQALDYENEDEKVVDVETTKTNSRNTFGGIMTN